MSRVSCFAVCCAALIATPVAAAPLSVHDLQLLNRVTWGADSAGAAEMQSLGAARWLDRQLHPAAADALPPQVRARIEAMSISTTPMADLARAMDQAHKALKDDVSDPARLAAAKQAYNAQARQLLTETAERSLLRDLYSPDQLREQMTWFWLNHFNVDGQRAALRPVIGDYEDRAIRPHALGRFRDLLAASFRHPAMLRYLNNAQNAAGRVNENYAREVMELHTMGVGSGYTQMDVQELARIFTGAGVSYRAAGGGGSLFDFDPRRHDSGTKTLLGHTIRGSGLAEMDEAIDILAREPATARHVSHQIAFYFIGDEPPAALVERMAATFQRTDGDIAEVLKTLFASPEFDASLGKAFKDPMHYALSAVRLAYDGRQVLDTTPLQGWLTRMGEGLYAHDTPDGYPLTPAAWSAPGQLAVRFEVAREIGDGAPHLFDPALPADRPARLVRAALTGADRPAMNAMDQDPAAPMRPTPVADRTVKTPPPALQAALSRGGLMAPLSAPTQGALAKADGAADWNALYLSSPDFMRR